MELSLFTTWEGGDGKRRREFNPYLRIGRFELLIDHRWGVDVYLFTIGFGWNRHIGFWTSRVID